MKKPLPSLAALSDEILAEVAADKRTKEAAQIEKTAAAPTCNTELGALLYKLSAEVRESPEAVTYEDLNAFIKGAGQ